MTGWKNQTTRRRRGGGRRRMKRVTRPRARLDFLAACVRGGWRGACGVYAGSAVGPVKYGDPRFWETHRACRVVCRVSSRGGSGPKRTKAKMKMKREENEKGNCGGRPDQEEEEEAAGRERTWMKACGKMPTCPRTSPSHQLSSIRSRSITFSPRVSASSSCDSGTKSCVTTADP